MSIKKTPSLASPLDAQEVKYRTPKSRKKERSVHDKELAEIAFGVYFSVFEQTPDFAKAHPINQHAWRAAVCAVLEEAIYRVKAKLNTK